ncbi:MAG: tRNA (guanosine(46)-N7)-methyltransferase TrmB [Sulfurimonadaceae bacterium]|nr:tRNA (guanosine(46)-N7)-methyltransferase TrmB [Sulfurimonadaceae bacterium]
MPHIHIKEFKTVATPAESGECRYDFIATNTQHDDEHLIATTVEDKQFFLLVKEGEESSLLKSDKITRPSATYFVQKGLRTYADLSGCDVIDSNVPDQAKNPHLASDSALKRINDFAENFPEAEEIRIEVGFGSGRHLLHQAKENPNILFIGLEIHKASIEQVLKQINIQELDNVLLLDYDARLFMEFVPSNVVGRIYVHFPVPWDKKPHRRVISEAFVNESIRVLKKGGRLELRTDSENYFQYSWETFISMQKVKLEVFKNQEIAITSKYEDRWRKMEKNIYDVTMICDEESEPLSLEGGFAFEERAVDLEKLKGFNGETRRFEGGFIHFERLYGINGTDKLMYRISMGSFDRPEHLYLIADENGAEYFPAPPVRSRTNLVAHSRLCELIYG